MKLTRHIYIVFYIFCCNKASQKTLILVTAYNRPDFIEWQYKTFKKFILDSYEYVIFNDAETPAMANSIEEVCKRFGIHHVRIPQTVHKNRQEGQPYWETSFNFPDKHKTYRVDFRAGEAAQYVLKTMGFQHNGIVAIIDSDIFVVKPVNINALVGDYAAWLRSPVLMLFNVPLLPSFSTVNLNAGFVGSQFFGYGWFLHQFYLSGHSEFKIKMAEEHLLYDLASNSEEQLLKAGYTKSAVGFFKSYVATLSAHKINKTVDSVLMIDTMFLHYCHGSNWVNLPDHVVQLKSKMLKEYLTAITS